MEFYWDNEQATFRDEVRAFIAAHLPENWESLAHGPGSREQTDFSKTFCNQLAQAGLLVPHWPKAWGGREADPWTLFILAEEMWMAGEPRGGQYMNVNWIGPTLMRYGSEAQQQRYIPPMAQGATLSSKMCTMPGNRIACGTSYTSYCSDSTASSCTTCGVSCSEGEGGSPCGASASGPLTACTNGVITGGFGAIYRM